MESCSHDYVVRHLCFCACVMCGRGGWQKGSSVESGAQALTDGHVITVRKSMLLDLRLPHTFISLAAGQTDVEDSCSKTSSSRSVCMS